MHFCICYWKKTQIRFYQLQFRLFYFFWGRISQITMFSDNHTMLSLILLLLLSTNYITQQHKKHLTSWIVDHHHHHHNHDLNLHWNLAHNKYPYMLDFGEKEFCVKKTKQKKYKKSLASHHLMAYDVCLV